MRCWKKLDFRLENFQGPMDLLLHLIERNKIPIDQIPIALLCDQYIAFLQPNLERNLDEISEFVLMAARLLELKAKSLLPKKSMEEIPDDENELARRLQQYLHYKEIGQKLKDAPILECWYRPINGEYANFCKKELPTIPDLLNNRPIAQFFALYQQTIARKPQAPQAPEKANPIAADPFTIDDKIRHIIQKLKQIPRIDFESLLPPAASNPEKLATFLALLELAKSESIQIMQEKAVAR